MGDCTVTSSSVFRLLRSVTASLCLLDFDTLMVVRSAGQLFWGTYHSFTSGVFLMIWLELRVSGWGKRPQRGSRLLITSYQGHPISHDLCEPRSLDKVVFATFLCGNHSEESLLQTLLAHFPRSPVHTLCTSKGNQIDLNPPQFIPRMVGRALGEWAGGHCPWTYLYKRSLC